MKSWRNDIKIFTQKEGGSEEAGAHHRGFELALQIRTLDRCPSRRFLGGVRRRVLRAVAFGAFPDRCTVRVAALPPCQRRYPLKDSGPGPPDPGAFAQEPGLRPLIGQCLITNKMVVYEEIS